MLVLTRRAGERIRVGDDIEIVVVSVRGDQVRLGFAAPRGVPIYRGELIEQVEQENLAAAESAVRVGSTATPGPARLPDPRLKSGRCDSETSSGAHFGGGPTGPPPGGGPQRRTYRTAETGPSPSLARNRTRPERRQRRAHG